MWPASSRPRIEGRDGGQKAALDFGRLIEIASHQLPRLLDLGEARLLDANGGDIGHDGEKVEIVAGELARSEGEST